MTVPRTKSVEVRKRSATSSKTSARRKDRHEVTKSYQMCHKVINTAELLEMILLEFLESEVPHVSEQKALLKVQSVSHVFQAAIKNSVKLQRTLGFVPDPSMAATKGGPVISSLLLPHYWSKIRRPIFSFIYVDTLIYFGPSPGAAFAVKVTDRRLVPTKAESWQRMLVRQGSKEDYWVTVARLPFLGMRPKQWVDVKCSLETTAGELMRMAREKFWNNGIRDGDLSKIGAEISDAAGGSEDHAIVL